MTDIQWDKLGTAYGPAIDIPNLLEQLRNDPKPKESYKDEPWFSLWSSLCHQGDVYTASYAAVPILIEIAQESDGRISPDFLLLPACIEVARATGHGPEIPDEFSNEYHAAIAKLTKVVEKYKDPNPELQTTIQIATYVATGKIEDAEQLLNS